MDETGKFVQAERGPLGKLYEYCRKKITHIREET